MSTSLFLALTLFGGLQDADPKVTIKSVAIPLSRALEEISKSTGKKLQATPANENEIVVLKVTDVPLSKLKERLAAVTFSKWTVQSDGLEILAIDSATRDIMARKEASEKIDGLQKSLNQLGDALKPKEAKPTKKTPGDAEEEAYQREYSERDELIALVTRGLRAADLAKIGANERWVYSTTPNAMQRPLIIGDMSRAMDAYIKAHNRDIVERGDPNEGMDPKMKEQMEKLQKVFGSFQQKNERISGTPTKLNLVITNRESMMGRSGMQLTLEGYDRNGQVLFTETSSLDRRDYAADMPEDVASVEAKDEKPPVQDPKLAQKIEFSPLTKELNGSVSFMQASSPPKPLSKELIEHLMRPDLYDPLSYEISESLLALADAEGVNLVANIPDEAMSLSLISDEGSAATIGSVKARYGVDGDVVTTFKDGWMSVQPKELAQLQSGRLNRVAFAKFLANTSKSLTVSLDTLADYAVSNPPLTESQIAMPYVMHLVPTAMAGMMRGGQDWAMLRLWGNLSSADKATLKSGKTLQISANSPKVKGLVKSMIFGADTNLEIDPQEDSPMAGIFGTGRMMRNSSKTSYREEPTELMPNGIPGNAVFSVALKSGQFLLADGETGGFAKMLGAMGAEEYAMFKYMSTDSRMAEAAAFMPKMGKFKVGDRDNITFKIQLFDDVAQRYSLMDSRMSANAATVDEKSLPKDFQDSVAKLMAMYKDLFNGLDMPGMFGEGVPPR